MRYLHLHHSLNANATIMVGHLLVIYIIYLYLSIRLLNCQAAEQTQTLPFCWLRPPDSLTLAIEVMHIMYIGIAAYVMCMPCRMPAVDCGFAVSIIICSASVIST